MNNFEFKNPTKLIFGRGQIVRIADEIPVGSRVMMTYGGGSIFKNGIYDQVKAALKDFQVVEFGGIEANPEYDTLVRAVHICREQQIDYLLAVGGGSVIDGTKFIAAAIHYPGASLWDILVRQENNRGLQTVPFGTVLTLPATGSEMNCGAVISRRELKEKFPFSLPNNYPQFSVLDPTACFSLPKRQLVNGIVDTFVHVMEQYLTYPVNAMIQDRFSEGILQTLVEIGPEILRRQTPDYDLMANFMLSATFGLNGLIAIGVPEDWASHMIGHELTALHGLDHGVTLAVVFPALIDVMRAEKKEKMLQYGERVWNITSGSEDERLDAVVKATRDFFESLGVKTRLSDYGIGTDTIRTITERFTQRGTRLGEHGTVLPETVGRILNNAL